MADYNKSVEITLKANIKQLQKNLEQIPGMTKKEASKMVRALSSEFNKAQKAAKKAAEESRKQRKRLRKHSRNHRRRSENHSREQQTKQPQQQERSRSLFRKQQKRQTYSPKTRKQSRRLSGLHLLPWINSLRVCPRRRRMPLRWLMDWRQQQSRQLREDLRQWLSLPAIVAGAAAYELYTKSSRMAAEQQKRLAEAQKLANEKLDEQFSIVQNITGDFQNANREYKLLTGQIIQLEFDLMTARDRSKAKTQEELEIQQKRVKEQQRLVRILEKARVSTNNLSDQEKELLNTAWLQAR